MTPITCFAGKNVALFGLGGSGLVSARALVAGGAKVTAWDDGAPAREKAAAQNIALQDLREADWKGFDALVLTPGVPLTHPEPHWAAKAAKAAGVEVIGDIELFCRERAATAPHSPFVAITGTNGKSTTTALIAHLLRVAGRDVAMGGNIGTAILDLPKPEAGRVHVVECSSFQIDLAPSLNPSVGILLNLTPDHLDRHGTMQNYADIKARLVRAADLAFVGVDDAYCAAIAAQPGRGEMVKVSVREKLESGIYADAATLWAARAGKLERLGDLSAIASLRGRHNAQNAAFAVAAAHALGVSLTDIQRGLQSFPGLAHRMEWLGERGKVLFINDSKATNADSTEKALLTFSDIYWIVGGKAKEGGLASLAPLFSRVSKAFLIGASSAEFARELDGKLAYESCGTLEVATQKAAQAAALSTGAQPVVLLSPACASYDQFPNFEVRGERFRSLCQAIINP